MSISRDLVLTHLPPGERLTCSQWAGKRYIIPGRTSIDRRDTPYDVTRLPYQREILDCYSDLKIKRITMMAPAQGGKTLPMHIMLGYTVDMDPGPTMYVMPDEKTVRGIMRERIIESFQTSPYLRRHLTGQREDVSHIQIAFRTMDLIAAWSNSPSAVASRPIYRLFLDETDKYPFATDREGSPCSLAIERLKNFQFAKWVECSSPTFRGGYIFQSYEKSDKREFQVKCPFCGGYQQMYMLNVRKPKDVTDPEEIILRQLAWYECEFCKKHWNNELKNKAVADGVWCPEDCFVSDNGYVVGTPRSTTHAGFHWSDLIVTLPTVTLSHCLGKFLEATHSVNPADLQAYQNSWMGEIWEEKIKDSGKDLTNIISLDYPLSILPKDGLVLVGGVDVQLKTIRYIVRGFGANSESWLIESDTINSFEELEERVILRIFNGPNATLYGVMLTCIDARYRTEEAYAFCSRHLMRTAPVHGKSETRGMLAMYSRHRVDTVKHRLPGDLLLERFDLNTGLIKDKIKRLQGDGRTENCMWHISSHTPREYCSQIFAEEKVRTWNKGVPEEVWRPKPGNPQNHFLDCEVYGMAAASLCQALQLPPIPVRTEQFHPVGYGKGTTLKIRTPDGRPFVAKRR